MDINRAGLCVLWGCVCFMSVQTVCAPVLLRSWDFHFQPRAFLLGPHTVVGRKEGGNLRVSQSLSDMPTHWPVQLSGHFNRAARSDLAALHHKYRSTYLAKADYELRFVEISDKKKRNLFFFLANLTHWVILSVRHKETLFPASY